MNAYVASVVGGLLGIPQTWTHSYDMMISIIIPTNGAMIRCRIATRLRVMLPDSIQRKNTSNTGASRIQFACAVTTRKNIDHGIAACAAVSGMANTGLLLKNSRMLS